MFESSSSEANTTARQAPETLDWDWNPIVFGGGVPVGGNAHLTIASDGTYTFSGHFHVSGAPSYNTALVWAVKDSQNIMYTFEDTGRVHGTFEPGSRDHDWVKTGHSDDIQRRWQYISAGWSQQAQANVNISLGFLIDAIKGALGIVASVIAIV